MSKITLAGCAIVEDNKIILLKRIKTGWYELPGGKIEDGESAEVAAEREIKEELLVDIKIVKKLGERDFVENGYTMSYIWFQAKIINNQEAKIGEPEKFSDLKYIAFQELRQQNLSLNMKNFVEEHEKGNILLSL